MSTIGRKSVCNAETLYSMCCRGRNYENELRAFVGGELPLLFSIIHTPIHSTVASWIPRMHYVFEATIYGDTLFPVGVFPRTSWRFWIILHKKVFIFIQTSWLGMWTIMFELQVVSFEQDFFRWFTSFDAMENVFGFLQLWLVKSKLSYTSTTLRICLLAVQK